VDIKIDFARVQDVGDNPSKTAACIIAWVGNAEAKVFCRYELHKKTGFLRDNDEVNQILTSKGKLVIAKNFLKKIQEWLTNISLTENQSPEKISNMFADFLKQGVKDYNAYSGYEDGLFKNTKPHNLVLPKNLDNSNVVFAILVHSEVHHAVSELSKEPDGFLTIRTQSQFEKYISDEYGSPIKNLLHDKDVIDLLLRKPEILTLLKKDKFVDFLDKFKTTNYDVLALVVEYADVLKKPDIKTQLDMIRNEEISEKKPTDNILEWILLAIGVLALLLLAVILWQFPKSQNKMDTMTNLISETKEMKLDKATSIELVANISQTILKQLPTNTGATQLANTPSKTEYSKDNIEQIADAIFQQVRKSYLIIEKSPIDYIVKKISSTVSQTQDIKEIVGALPKNVTLDAQSKEEILRAISAQNAKVEQEQKELEHSRATVQNELTKTQQNMQKTEGKLSETKTQLDEVKNQHQNMKNSLEALMKTRFGVAKLWLLPEMSGQEGTWRWLQNVLTVQYENYNKAFLNVKKLQNPECEKILELLNIQSILKHWYEFLTDNPHLESNERLMGLLEARDGGMWLSNVLRADELFKMYFSDKAELNSLITPLAITTMMLQAALKELGVEVIKPRLLESPPADLAPNARKMTTNPVLMELIHGKVMTKLSDDVPQLVVDVERYGFVTAEGTSNTAMKVLVADLGGWEQY